MKAGISIYSYGTNLRTGLMTVEDALRHAASIGCRGVELIGEQHLSTFPYSSPDELMQIKNFIASLGMELTCFSCYLYSLGRSDREATFKEYIEMTRRYVSTAALLGAKIFRPAYKNQTVEELVTLVKACLPILEEYGVIWGAEIHSPQPPSYFIEAYEQINSPWFRLVPDFSCWQQGENERNYGGEPVETLGKLVPMMCYCHGKGYKFGPDGRETTVPFDELLGTLQKAGYNGFVVAEFEDADLSGDALLQAIETHFSLIQQYADQ